MREDCLAFDGCILSFDEIREGIRATKFDEWKEEMIRFGTSRPDGSYHIEAHFFVLDIIEQEINKHFASVSIAKDDFVSALAKADADYREEDSVVVEFPGFEVAHRFENQRSQEITICFSPEAEPEGAGIYKSLEIGLSKQNVPLYLNLMSQFSGMMRPIEKYVDTLVLECAKHLAASKITKEYIKAALRVHFGEECLIATSTYEEFFYSSRPVPGQSFRIGYKDGAYVLGAFSAESSLICEETIPEREIMRGLPIFIEKVDGKLGIPQV